MWSYYFWCIQFRLFYTWNIWVTWVIEFIAGFILVPEPTRIYPTKPKGGFYSWKQIKGFHRTWYSRGVGDDTNIITSPDETPEQQSERADEVRRQNGKA